MEDIKVHVMNHVTKAGVEAIECDNGKDWAVLTVKVDGYKVYDLIRSIVNDNTGFVLTYTGGGIEVYTLDNGYTLGVAFIDTKVRLAFGKSR